MTIEMVQRIVDAMYYAGNISRIVPKLPSTLKTGQLAVLSTLFLLKNRGQQDVKVTDISNFRRVTSPSTIRTITSCINDGLLVKRYDENDRRVAYLDLTETGQNVIDRTLIPYDERIAEKLSDIPDEDWQLMIRLIDTMLLKLQEVTNEMGGGA